MMSFSVAKGAPAAGPLRLGPCHKRIASTRALTAQVPSAQRRGRGRLAVEANELNKWAGRAMDDDAGYDENPFDRDTAAVLLRVLTARSVKLLLTQLQELDVIQAHWFNQYCADNPPTTGNAFLAALFQEKGVTVVEATTQTSHAIDPQNLAHRVLQIRMDMAARATSALPTYTELENTGVLRAHLERSTFVSGSHEATAFKDRGRGYFRPPRGS